MKTLLSILLMIVFIYVTGCGCLSFSRPYRYCMDIENIGKRKIWVGHITPYESQNHYLVVTGVFEPGVKTSSGPFYKKPSSKIPITWEDSDNKKTFVDTITIKLPELFPNKEYGANIIIYIDSDTNKVFVAYNVFDSKKEDFIIVDSNGVLFDINKTK